MVEIDLGQTSGSYSSGDTNIEIKKDDYENDFEKITYTIAYPWAFSYVWYNWWTSYNIHNVYIKNKANKTIFSSYVKQNSQVVLEVESYHSKYHPEIPLVLGFKRTDGKYHYPYRLLWSLEEFYGLPRHSFEQYNLKNRLNSDNKRRNKITFKLKGSSQNYLEERDDKTYPNFIQYKYSVDRYNYFGPYSISTDTLFKREKNIPIDFSIFTNVNNQEYDFINIFYTINNIALLIQFVQHFVLTSKTTYQYFKRKSKDCTNWDDISNEVTNSSVDNLKALLKNLYYSINDSIVILANKNEINLQYPLNLIDNSVIRIVTPETPIQTTNKITVKQNQESLSDLKYKSYEHSLTQPTETESPQPIQDVLSNVSGLRIFIGSSTKDTVQLEQSVEIKLYSHDGKERKHLYYESNITGQSSPDKKNKVYCYFYDNDNVPLMLYGGGFFYRPKSLKEYFQKWVQIPDLTFTQKSTVDSKLKEINKEFNLIDLSQTSSYGLNGHESGNLPENFNKDRITVTTETPGDNSFTRIKHTTTNSGPIGKVTYSDEELMVLTEQGDSGVPKLMSTEIKNDNYNTVYAYYHRSDSRNEKPLLLGFAKSPANPDMFFERNDNTPNSSWKRVSGTSSLQSDSSRSEKINKLQYNFNSSILIQIEKQFGTSSNTNYPLKLVKNGPTKGSEAPSDANITVSQDDGRLTGSNYKCYKHSINLGNTKPSDVGGLRFYVHEKELTFSNNTGNLFIYFNYLQVYVYVYFHKESPLPLLVSYEKKYYGPSSRDKYFDKWEEKTDIGDNITQKLDEINRFLNNIELSETTNSKSGKKYGIIKPGKDPPKGLGDYFYNRIYLKPCVTTNYRKLTHSTINKFGIGSILFHGKPISTIQVQSNENEVSVYYHHDDTYFTRPLMLSLGSQTQEEAKSSITRKWYKRNNLQGTDWSPDVESDDITYSSQDGGRLKDELEKIAHGLFSTLQIEIQQQYGYNIKVTTEKYRENESTINVEKFGTCGGFDIKEYRCCEHKPSQYYNNIIGVLKSQPLNTEGRQDYRSTSQELNFILEPSISGIKLGIFNKNGNASPVLTYTQQDANQNHSLFVYFAKTIEEEDDCIPVMFNYSGTFFGPSSKDEYFCRWNNLSIDTVKRGAGGHNPEEKVRENLDSIYNRLNEIDLSKTSSYGLKCCRKHPYYNNKSKFSTKRVDVTKYSNSDYIMYVHKTLNMKIGSIKSGRDAHNFDQHSTQLSKQTIDEVAVIYKGKTISEPPLLVFLNQTEKYSDSSTTYGYYYKDAARGDTYSQYEFYPITGGCKIISKLMGQGEEDCVKVQTKVLGDIWNSIIAIPMNLVRGTEQSDVDTTSCKGPVANEKLKTTCDGDDKFEDSTDTGSDSSREDQDQDGKADRSLLNGQSSSGHVDTPEQVPAAPQAPQSNDSLGQTSLRTEEQGDLGAGREDDVDEEEEEAGAPRPGADDDARGGSSGDVSSGAMASEGAHGPVGPEGKPGLSGQQGPRGDKGDSSPPPSTPSAPHSETELSTTVTRATPTRATQSHQHNNGDGGDRARDGGVPGEKGEGGPQSQQSDTGSSSGIGKVFEENLPYIAGGGGAAGVGVIGGVGAVVYKKFIAVGH